MLIEKCIEFVLKKYVCTAIINFRGIGILQILSLEDFIRVKITFKQTTLYYTYLAYITTDCALRWIGFKENSYQKS